MKIVSYERFGKYFLRGRLTISANHTADFVLRICWSEEVWWQVPPSIHKIPPEEKSV